MDTALEEAREEILPIVEANGHWHGETTGLRADGTTFIEDHTLSLTEEGGLVCSIRNKTERKKQTEALQSHRERLEIFSSAFPDVSFILDETGRCVELLVGPESEDVLYQNAAELQDKRLHDVFPDEQANQFMSVIQTALDTNETHTIDFELSVPEGKRWFEGRTVPIQYEIDGKQAVVWVSRDITDRKEYEQELIRQNERLDQFADVVSHDLRDPLNVARGRLELAQQECDTEHLIEADDALDRIESLTENVLKMARDGGIVLGTEILPLTTLAKDAWGSVDTKPGQLTVTDVPDMIRGDPDRVRRLFENLFRNAIEHGGDNVTVTVGSLTKETGFYVEDDGNGLPDTDPDHLFEWGNSLDDGPGYGLAIVEQIVDAHGWTITATDSRDGGARFEITTRRDG